MPVFIYSFIYFRMPTNGPRRAPKRGFTTSGSRCFHPHTAIAHWTSLNQRALCQDQWLKAGYQPLRCNACGHIAGKSIRSSCTVPSNNYDESAARPRTAAAAAAHVAWPTLAVSRTRLTSATFPHHEGAVQGEQPKKGRSDPRRGRLSLRIRARVARCRRHALLLWRRLLQPWRPWAGLWLSTHSSDWQHLWAR